MKVEVWVHTVSAGAEQPGSRVVRKIDVPNNVGQDELNIAVDAAIDQMVRCGYQLLDEE